MVHLSAAAPATASATYTAAERVEGFGPLADGLGPIGAENGAAESVPLTVGERSRGTQGAAKTDDTATTSADALGADVGGAGCSADSAVANCGAVSDAPAEEMSAEVTTAQNSSASQPAKRPREDTPPDGNLPPAPDACYLSSVAAFVPLPGARSAGLTGGSRAVPPPPTAPGSPATPTTPATELVLLAKAAAAAAPTLGTPGSCPKQGNPAAAAAGLLASRTPVTQDRTHNAPRAIDATAAAAAADTPGEGSSSLPPFSPPPPTTGLDIDLSRGLGPVDADETEDEAFLALLVNSIDPSDPKTLRVRKAIMSRLKSVGRRKVSS